MYKSAMPIVEAMRNDNLKETHWNQIKELIKNPDLDVNAEGFTLNSLLEMNVVQFEDQICEISVRATGEAKL